MKQLKVNDSDITVIWELRGSYPNVPNFEDIDIAELTKGDADPMFLTLPIGEVNTKSGNGRYYDEKWLTELERQVKKNRPIGIMGHLRESDLATEFPLEAIHWVGTQRIQETLWGKGYVPAGESRERIRRYKATNKSLATSIFAKAQGVWDATVDAYRMIAESMQLHHIDIAPADRAGIPSLARIPALTAEMESQDNEGEETPEENETMDKLTVINEMTADDARLLPQPVQDAILATVQPAPEVGIVSELCDALGVDDAKGLTALVVEMKQAQEAAAKQAVTMRINEMVTEGVKVETMRPIVIELINSKQPATVEEAATAYQTVVEMESVKAQLVAAVKMAMGPNQNIPAQPTNGKNKYFAIPNKEAK